MKNPIVAKLFSKLFRRNRHGKSYCGEIILKIICGEIILKIIPPQ